MSEFDNLEGAIQQPQMVITENDVAFRDEDLADDVALSIVLSDTITAEQFLQSKQLLTDFDAADHLFGASVQPRTWPNGKPRSALPQFVVLEAIEKILRGLHLTLWGNGKQPFALTPIGKTTPAAARAKSKVLSWAIKQAGLKEEMRLTLKTCLQYGFVVGNWGWRITPIQESKYVRGTDGKITRQNQTKELGLPFYECLDIRKVLIDPACYTPDVRKSAKYVILQSAITANDLDALREDPDYKNIPSREELALILARNEEAATDSFGNQNTSGDLLRAEASFKATSADPLQQPLEILEYWSDDRVITVLQRKIVIRNQANEYGRKTQVSCAFIDKLNSAYGFGIAKLLGGEQKFQAGVRNTWVDSLALQMNPSWYQEKSVGVGTQQVSVSPGKVITGSGELKPLLVPSVTAEALGAIESSSIQANRLVGANGGTNMPSQAMRTAEGVQAFSGDVLQSMQYFIELFIESVFVPVLEAFLEMCCDRLEPEQLNLILTEEEGKAYEGDVLDVYNAKCKVDVVAGTKLTAKFAAAQLVPQIVTIISNAPFQDSLIIQNKKFDYKELMSEYLELMGWELNSLIIDMTPEDQQRAQMMNAAFLKGQQDVALEQQRHQNELEKINEKGTVQAGVALIRQAAKDNQENALETLEQMNSPMVGTV